MPQEKFITREKGGIFSTSFADALNSNVGTNRGSRIGDIAERKDFTKRVEKINRRFSDPNSRYSGDPTIRGLERKGDISKARNAAEYKGFDAEQRMNSRVVTGRDATNARIARERLAARATAAGKPQPFITRKDAGIVEARTQSKRVPGMSKPAYTERTGSNNAVFQQGVRREKDFLKRMDPLDRMASRTPPERVEQQKAGLAKLRAQSRNDMVRSRSIDVTARDASNAANARARLAARSSAAKAQPKGGGMMAKAAALGPVAEGAAALYAADEATGFKRTKYSGNFGGPSFSMNPYASSNKPAYSGQSNVSKLMGVGRKK